MSKDLKTASVLAFERKLDPSDALLYSGEWEDRHNVEDWPGVPIREKSVRGTISNRLKAKEQDPAKLDAAIENPNLQTVDVAALPMEHDTLMARFTLKVLGGAGRPSACNNSEYEARLGEVVRDYVEKHGFNELASRYASNLANGRFLWRNRVGAEEIEIHVRRVDQGVVAEQEIFEALTMPFRAFDSATSGLNKVARWIEQGLSGENFTLLDILAFVRVGRGQEVFPSQELILDRQKSEKSKTLYQVEHVAGIHSQKIGNAIRSIDTWYPTEGEQIGPIAAEPYGSVTTRGTAYRQPRKKADFYSLLDKWVLKGEAPDVGNQHFVMAILIRGGVFGEKQEQS